ncbi:MAG TPA: hypothetical protein VMV86_06235 [Methanosarcinales archaeon]|nr:hypothetical protein [Methanosarcinales archaeon]
MDKELTLKLLVDTQANLSKAIGGMIILGLDIEKASELAKEYAEAMKQIENDLAQISIGGVSSLYII